MNAPNAKVAEQLWLRAHESIRRGELANAVRDLAKAFEILKALQDPRLAQVHARWVDVHRMYKEESARGGARAAEKPEAPKTLQAQAEAAANEGDIQRAIALYEKIVAESPANELAKERLSELRQAKERAEALSRPPQPAAPVASAPVATAPAATAPAAAAPAATAPVATTPVATTPVATAPVATAPVATAPLATVPVATAPVATAPVASAPVATAPVATAPVAPAATAPVATAPVATAPVATAPAPAGGVDADIAFLEGLLGQIQTRAAEPR